MEMWGDPEVRRKCMANLLVGCLLTGKNLIAFVNCARGIVIVRACHNGLFYHRAQLNWRNPMNWLLYYCKYAVQHTLIGTIHDGKSC
jgi:hypothetical protein